MDSEVASAIRGRVCRGKLSSRAGRDLLERYRRLGITRHSTFPMFERVWELRNNLSAYDAAYVALAEILDCPLPHRRRPDQSRAGAALSRDGLAWLILPGRFRCLGIDGYRKQILSAGDNSG
jgi:hypothetical protein